MPIILRTQHKKKVVEERIPLSQHIAYCYGKQMLFTICNSGMFRRHFFTATKNCLKFLNERDAEIKEICWIQKQLNICNSLHSGNGVATMFNGEPANMADETV